MALRYWQFLCLALFCSLSLGCNHSSGSNSQGSGQDVTLLNVSYDPTREFYAEFNENFKQHYEKTNNVTVNVEQSHGGSGKQARAVIDGLEADVVTLALAYDIQAIATKGKLIPDDWQARLPNNSAPYTSTIVFLVRKGNPKQIRDWDDLVKGDVSIITPNPKTSGGARWNYLAAWGYALKKELGDLTKLKDPAQAEAVKKANDKARAFVTQIYKRVPVLDSGARGATNTFAQREIGDVLLAWENEAFLAKAEAGGENFEIVTPSISILAEPPVTLVDAVAKKKGTTEVAKAYLQHLYSPQGQQLAAKHFFRPSVKETLSEEQLSKFAQLSLFTIDEAFGGWTKVQPEHFDDNGIFDQIYQPSK
jgi:sulfate/thiosulfate transport system substrate-binding protein